MCGTNIKVEIRKPTNLAAVGVSEGISWGECYGWYQKTKSRSGSYWRKLYYIEVIISNEDDPTKLYFSC